LDETPLDKTIKLSPAEKPLF